MADETRPRQSRHVDATYGKPVEVIAERCGVDVSTARRWKAGATRLPYAAQLILSGDLGCFDPTARGWRILNGELISPEGWCVSLNEVRSVPLMRQQISTYQKENRELKSALDFKAANEPELNLIEIRA